MAKHAANVRAEAEQTAPARRAKRSAGTGGAPALSAAGLFMLQRSAGNRAVGGLVQRAVNNSAATGLTNNMTALFIDRHVLSTPASTAVAPPNAVPPRETSDKSYVRDRNWGNTSAAYKQALNRFNNLAGGQTHVVEMPNAYPEWAPGKRMRVANAKRVKPGHVEMIVDAGWKFSKVPVNAAVAGLRENAGAVAHEAVLESTSASSRTAVLGVQAGKINHFPAEENPFLH